MRRPNGQPLALVLLVVAVLYGVSLDHGLPHRFVPDDSAVKASLGIAQSLKGGDGTLLERLVPESGTSTTYPYLLPYVNLVGVGGRFALGKLRGEWAGPGEFADRVMLDPSLAWLPARIIAALLAWLLPWGVYRASRELGRDKGEAALAALLGGASLLVVQYAHTTRPWAPMIGLGAMTLAACLRLGARRRWRDAAWAAMWGGLTAATHQVGVLGLLLVGFATLLYPPSPGAGWRRVPALIGAWGVGLVTVMALGYPFALVYGRDAGAGSIAADAASGVDIGGQFIDLSMLEGQRLVAVALSWIGYDPVLIVAGVLGLVVLWRARVGRGLLLVALPALGHAAVFLVYDGTHVRYLMPAVPFLAVGAGAALAALARSGAAGRLLAVVLVAFPLVQAARLDQLLGREDTRVVAARRILELTGPQDVLAVDHHGATYAPPLAASAECLEALEPLVDLTGREQRALELARAGVAQGPDVRFVVPVTRFWIYKSYHDTDYTLGPPRSFEQVLADWGVSVYVQVDRDFREPRAPVDALVAAHGRLIAEFSPTGSTAPSEAQLPTDLDRPLTFLWGSERPGPWIRVWRIEP